MPNNDDARPLAGLLARWAELEPGRCGFFMGWYRVAFAPGGSDWYFVDNGPAGRGVVQAAVQEAVGARGFWLVLKSPFEPGLPWFAGLNPHSTTGWNGRPDHVGEADTPAAALLTAYIAALEAAGGRE